MLIHVNELLRAAHRVRGHWAQQDLRAKVQGDKNAETFAKGGMDAIDTMIAAFTEQAQTWQEAGGPPHPAQARAFINGACAALAVERIFTWLRVRIIGHAFSFCVQCGVNVPYDEYGCCCLCGCDATGEHVSTHVSG